MYSFIIILDFIYLNIYIYIYLFIYKPVCIFICILIYIYIFVVLFLCTQFSVFNDPLNSEHIKIAASVLSLRLFPHLSPPYVARSAFSWEDKLWWWRHRTDVKHGAIIFLCSSLFQSTCICQTGVLFCCVSTCASKRYTAVSNRRRCLWIPMWEHDADDFYYNSVSPSRILQMKHPTCFLTL